MICPRCGNSSIEIKRENHGEVKGKNGKQIIHETVAFCKNCGMTWDPNYIPPPPKPQKPKKPIYKRVWFWIIIAFILIGALSPKTNNKTEKIITQTTENIVVQEENTNNIIYELKGEELGEYGRKVILNENTDLPVAKYLYKLPAGTYEVTTDNDKMASFFIVKDEIYYNNDNPDYPEELNYVSSESYLLTAGDNDFNGHAKKSVIIELAKDESIQIVWTDTLFFKKIN